MPSWFLILLVLAFAITRAEAEELPLTVGGDIDVLVDRYPAAGDYLLLWLAPEYGFRPAHRSMAQQLRAQGIEVWLVDLTAALFLPRGTASLKQLEGNHVADLIEAANRTSGKKIAVVGDSYAAINALRGARQWQNRRHAEPYLIGAILFTPYSYAYIPELGLAPDYLPIVAATNIPLMIYQAEKSATTNLFDDLLEKLRSNDSPVYTRLLPGIMSLFYQEAPTGAMIANAEPTALSLKRILPLLAQHRVPARPVPVGNPAQVKSGIDIYLKEFKGAARPVPINLPDINGDRLIRNDFAGKVTLVNFWATWCPPCLEEIPSLNRLQRKMTGRPFELISINYAEDKDTVTEFVRRIEVEFPVLLDQAGIVAGRWNVVSFPSTFIIDRQGEIRYGVNAAIDWDTPELMRKLDPLLKK